MKKTFTIIGLIAVSCLSASAQSYPFTDNFESYGGFGSALKLATTQWNSKGFYVYQPRGTNGSKGAQSGLTSNSRIDSLVSPEIGPMSPTTQLSFNYRLVEYIGSTPLNTILQTGDVFEVQVSQDNGATYTTLSALPANTTSDYLSKAVNLSAYEGRLLTIRFYGQLNTGANRSVFFQIDDVAVIDAVGTNRAIDNTKLAVFPNPANGNVLQIAVQGVADNNAIVTVTDLAGKNIITQSLAIQANANAALTLPAGLNGIYLVTVQTEQGRFAQKVVVCN
jgi:hypothetical protein